MDDTTQEDAAEGDAAARPTLFAEADEAQARLLAALTDDADAVTALRDVERVETIVRAPPTALASSQRTQRR